MEPLIRKDRNSYIRPLSLFLFEVPLNRKIVKNDSSTYFSYGLLSRHNGVKTFMKGLQEILMENQPSFYNLELFIRELVLTKESKSSQQVTGLWNMGPLKIGAPENN